MNRACPVVLRQNDEQLEILVFRHPKNNIQLSKGRIQKNESLQDACVRELKEESGIHAEVVRQLGILDVQYKHQVWGFCLMHFNNTLPDTWDYQTEDDGGKIFSFFWHPIKTKPSENWHPASKEAFYFIQNTLTM